MTTNSEYMKKFKPDDPSAIRFFVQHGYVVYEGVHDHDLIDRSRDWFFAQYNKLLEHHKKGEIPFDVNGWAAAIIDKYRLTEMGDRFITSPKVVDIMKQLLGPDLAIFDQDALWINAPKDTDPVLLKGTHTDAWTGTSINTIFAKTFFTDVDQHNGMSVCPGSHLYGLVPVRNRSVDPAANIKLEEVNLQHMKAGDLLIWHALLLHATVGHSDKNIRMSITSRFTSTETPFSSQERGLGYRTLAIGPMNQILRLIGTDQLLPFRTYGGYVGVDRRLQKLYGYSNYKVDVDYAKYLG